MRLSLLLAIPVILCAKVPQLAVLPLSSHGVDSSSAAVLAESISDAFLRTGKVRVMERQQINLILKEQGFEKSGACDASECAVKMGQLLGIDQIVLGSIGKLGKSYVLSLRRVDVGTGKILSTSSRNKSGAIDDLLDVIDNSVEDLIGSAPKERTEPEEPVEISRQGSDNATRVESSNLPARTAKVREPGFHSIDLELGRDLNSGVNDIFVWKDSSGKQAGWVRLSHRAHEPEFGGEGDAVLVSGDPDEGQMMEKLAQAPWVLEGHVGTESWYDSDRSELLDITALLWYRSTGASNFWTGIGVLMDVNRLRSGSLEVAPGLEISLHKGFTVQKHLGWFMEGALACTPSSEWRSNVQILLRPGLSWDITPGLQFQAKFGRNLWEADGLVSNTSEGGQYIYAASLVWSPTFDPKRTAEKGNAPK